MPSSGFIVGTGPGGAPVPIAATADGRAKVDVPPEEAGEGLLRALIREVKLLREAVCDRTGAFFVETPDYSNRGS